MTNINNENITTKNKINKMVNIINQAIRGRADNVPVLK